MKRFLRLSLIVCFFLTFLTPLTTAAADGQLIIINKATNELAFYENNQLNRLFKVATGRSPELTPEGSFIIVNKIKNRPYYKENIAGGDPSNPLGDRWLGLNARETWGTTYAIHGNNNPNSIGTYASAGCIRMYDEEVRWLFERVKVNTTVLIVTSSDSFGNIAKANGYNVSGSKQVSAPATSNVMQLGNNGKAVEEIQQLLNDLGYAVNVTGTFDDKTDRAVRKFQKDYGLTVDGLVGKKTKNALENPQPKPSTSQPTNDTSTEKDSSHTIPTPTPEQVKEIQEKLRKLGYYLGDYDAYYGFNRPAKD